MDTKILQPEKETIEKACKLLQKGELVAIPTETVYGLSANALDENAVSKIFLAKGRPSDNPLIVHVSSLEMMRELITVFPENAQKLADEFWPGPLTMILQKSEKIPEIVSAGLQTVGIRFPEHNIAREIIEKSKLPLAAPSANTSGMPSPTKAEHVLNDLNGKIPLIVEGGECAVGVESTVIDLSEDVPLILRPGGISFEEIREILPDVQMDNYKESESAPRSPGMKYRHYAPSAPLIIVKGEEEYILSHETEDIGVLCFNEYAHTFKKAVVCTFGSENDSEEQAKKLFDALRFFDNKNVKKIYAQCPKTKGIGLAVYNRLLKAAGYNILEVSNMLIVGITGGSGTGKNEVSSYLKTLGAEIIDADKIYHELTENSKEMLFEIKETFGDVLDGGVLDRKKLGNIVFRDKVALEKLNAITHRYIEEKVKNVMEKHRIDGKKICVYDAPLLFNSNSHKMCDIIIGVIASSEKRVERIMKRDNISEEYARNRINSQNNDDFYIEKCDIIIENNGTVLELHEKVNEIKLFEFKV